MYEHMYVLRTCITKIYIGEIMHVHVYMSLWAGGDCNRDILCYDGHLPKIQTTNLTYLNVMYACGFVGRWRL